MKKLKVKVLRRSGEHCSDGDWCPAVIEIEGVPGRFVVGKQILSADIQAALAPYIGAGENVTWTPPDLEV